MCYGVPIYFSMLTCYAAGTDRFAYEVEGYSHMNYMLNAREFRLSLGIGFVFATRVFGLMVVLPLFAFAQSDYLGATQFLLGLAFGIYGLTQGLLQIPLGILSDQYGRKTIIVIGLLFMVVGSLVAAYSTGIMGLIVGRFLQGMGAIGSTCIAFIGDVIRPRARSIGMAIVGGMIGLTFLMSVGLASWLEHQIGLHGIFLLSGLLPILSIIVVLCVRHDADLVEHVTANWFQKIRSVLADRSLSRLNYSIASLHAIFSGVMMFVPVILMDSLNIPRAEQWQVLMPVILLGFVFALPFLSFSEKTGHVRPLFMGGVLLLWFALTLFLFGGNVRIWFALFFLFFSFSCLEAKIPSLITQYAPVVHRGTASGIYSSCQYLGIFIGSMLSSLANDLYGIPGVFLMNIALVFFWLIVLMTMKLPTIVHKNYDLPDLNQEQCDQLRQKLRSLQGVRSVCYDPQMKQFQVAIITQEGTKGAVDVAVETFVALHVLDGDGEK
jgi:MFS family permease